MNLWSPHVHCQTFIEPLTILMWLIILFLWHTNICRCNHTVEKKVLWYWVSTGTGMWHILSPVFEHACFKLQACAAILKLITVFFSITLSSISNISALKLTCLITDFSLIRRPSCWGVVAVECVFSHMRARLASEDAIMCFFSLRNVVQRSPSGNTHVQQHRFLSRWTWDDRLRYVHQTPL